MALKRVRQWMEKTFKERRLLRWKISGISGILLILFPIVHTLPSISIILTEEEQIQLMLTKNQFDDGLKSLDTGTVFNLEFPQSLAEIKRAQISKADMDPTGSRRIPMPRTDEMPLDVWFAEYTIGLDGREADRFGWSPTERDRMTHFLLRMLPILQELYGDPYYIDPLRRPSVTLVKDLRYWNSWIFIPDPGPDVPLHETEIHAAGVEGASWDPRLLTHEFVHAFRGRRTLTSDAQWRYQDALSGFEEGFGEGVAYMVMNRFAERYCPGGMCPIEADAPSFQIWNSELEWAYDFYNNSSMTTENFWSAGGGTYKYMERYLMGSAAIDRLEVAIPNFSRRFNEEYYAWIAKDSAFRPSRDAVVGIIESLSPQIEGMPAAAWIDRQRIFDCQYLRGKKDYVTAYDPRDLGHLTTVGGNTYRSLFFLETFPGSSYYQDWYYPVPEAYQRDCPRQPPNPPYLYYRLGGSSGQVYFESSWDGSFSREFNVVMRPAGDAEYLGCNAIRGSFGAVEMQFVSDASECRVRPTGPGNIVCMVWPATFGLYQVRTTWVNPHFRAPPQAPAFGIAYDNEQAAIETYYWHLSPPGADYQPSTHRFVGGIIGAVGARATGTLRITHSAVPGEVVTPVRNGAFYTSTPPNWVRPYRVGWPDWLMVTSPGILTFTYTASDGFVHVERRTVVFGQRGTHQFLLDMSSKK